MSALALLAKQAGFDVSGSDKQDNHNLQTLREKGIANINIGQTWGQIAHTHASQPIDWLVYTSALPMEQPDADELRFCQKHNIRATKRDEFLSFLLEKQNLKMIAVAGTHGKTTTTAMAVWAFKQLGLPVSYALPSSISFGESAQLAPGSEFFVYEADEFDRNFLAFHPHLSIITGVDWDHPDIYPTRGEYYQAFRDFLAQSQNTIIWNEDAQRLNLTNPAKSGNLQTLEINDPQIDKKLRLPGRVNRQNAWQVAHAINALASKSTDEALEALNRFPGVGRRFEQIAPNLISDYAHTAPKIRGALQMAREVAGDNFVVVYEGLHNTRQHFMKDELADLFSKVKKLYVVPSYLAREDPNLPLLTPIALRELLSKETQAKTKPAALNSSLKNHIKNHLENGDLVLCLTAGGGGSLDEWLRNEFGNGLEA